MTTTVTTAETGPLTANGTTPLAFTFQAVSASEIEVLRNGVVVAANTYSVALNPDGTGTVTPLATWGTDTVYIRSAPNYINSYNFERFAPTYPDQFNGPLDRLTRMLIALRGWVMRTLPVLGNVTTGATASITPRYSNGILYWDMQFPQSAAGANGTNAVNPNYSYAINTGAAGTSAGLVVSGTYPNILLTFTIPRGDPGASGALVNGTYSGIVVTGGGTALDVAPGHITLARMANLAANSILGNNTGSAATPIALTFAQVKTALALSNVDNTSDANKPVSTAQSAAISAAVATKANSANPALTGGDSATIDTFPIGYRDLPIVNKTGAFTFAAADRAKGIYYTGAAAAGTIDPNGTTAIPTGAAYAGWNNGTGVLTITRGSGVSLYVNGSTTSSHAAVAIGGRFTLIKWATNVWTIDGSGVTAA